MRAVLKRLAKMVAGYGLVQWGGPFLSLIFTPIITRVLTPADYGIADYILTVGGAVGTLATLALPQALTAHYNDQPTPEWKRQVVGSALAAAIPIGTLIYAMQVVLAPQIAQASFGSQTYVNLFRLMGAAGAFSLCGVVLTTAAQAELRVRWGMLFSLTSILGLVFGNVLFIVVLRLGATGLILTAVTNGIMTFVMALAIARSLVGKPSAPRVKMLLRSGAWLLPTTLAAWMLQVVDRFFLVKYVSMSMLGYYAIANKIASLLGVALIPIFGAWIPLALTMQHSSDAPYRYMAMARYLMAAALLGSLGLGLFATEILIVVTRTAYLPAAPYVGLLTYVYVFSAMNVTLTISGLIDKQLKSISGSVVAGALVNVALNFVLIPPYGVWGATIATAVGYAVPVGVLYFRLRPRLPMPYPIRLFVMAVGVQLMLLGVGLLIPPLAFPLRVGIKIVVFSTLPLAFIGLGIITRFEVRQGWLFAQNQLRRAFPQRI